MSNENSYNKGMFDVSSKPDTYRMAKAQAILNINPSTSVIINEGKSPKGDVIQTARIAATQAAKKTYDLLPYCHPIPIDHVLVEISIKSETIEITVEVKSVWKTGVEMEALTGACIGALTIYDMLKPIDNSLSISSTKLLSKSGGIKNFDNNIESKIKVVVLVMSNSISAGRNTDKSGKLIVERLIKVGFDVIEYKVLPDNANVIEDSLRKYSDEMEVNLIVTSGGTGLGPHDLTPEATKKVIEREIIGISETARTHGQRRTPLSMLSRGISGIRGKTLIINLPGSVKAVSESLDSLLPGLIHAFSMIEGHGH